MHVRHDELRDVVGNLLSEVCNDVAIEPHLTPATGENLQDQATLARMHALM